MAPPTSIGAPRAGTVGLFVALVGANICAWLWAYALFAERPAIMATALLAFVFGLRHAVDADHIAAIDNVVRKLMHEGHRPVGAGLYFSLGHSTVVILASFVLAASAAAMKDELSAFKSVGSLIGASVSAGFLLIVGVANLVILRGVWKSFRLVSRGEELDPESLNILLAGRGFLARLFRPIFGAVRKSWHMYPLGFLFGLGFDTATEIGLLSISAAAAARDMSALDTLVFPALFTAGMALVDTADSALMVGAYGWAFVDPIRKLWYNLTITAASAAVAFLIGGVEVLALISDRLGFEGGFWRALDGLTQNLAQFGFVVAGIFLIAWIGSSLIYRINGYARSGSLAPAHPKPIGWPPLGPSQEKVPAPE
ncbi:HoxN/HupN/NixA family nickel/cobalt transporter [Methylocapsa aurea]|uniref:HoxN/HupN/NixA family nickel/cobalt transporter n=1 Tax=Methylocapsa aurea TaxID=663610 RepID=UPI000A072B1A|nr:HoxN/HupN/NixA family nickel/cobalt transporter [Methylocapsa aurea]